MIRVVFDTNIVISAFFWGGAPRTALIVARNRRFQLITSESLLIELGDVMRRAKFARRLTAIDVTASVLIDEYRGLAEVVEPADIGPMITDDPDDDSVLACAVGGEADLIVSGDTHLLALQQYHDIAIWPIGRFLAEGLAQDG